MLGKGGTQEFRPRPSVVSHDLAWSLRIAAVLTQGYDWFMQLGFPEMMFIFILALILFGPKKLPEIGKQIGKGLAEFKRASREFQSQIEDEVRKLEVEADLKNTIAPLSLTETVSSQPPTLTIAKNPEPAPSEAAPASTPEIAAAAAHPDYTVESTSSKADSAGHA